MTEIVVPHWVAELLIRDHGSLQAAAEHYGIGIVDDYWAQLACETEKKVNPCPGEDEAGGQLLAPKQPDPTQQIHTEPDEAAVDQPMREIHYLTLKI